MAKSVIDFVENWIRENVNAGAYVAEEEQDPRPAELARQCTREAAAHGISEADIAKEYGDLSDRMATAIDEVADAEVDRLASNDD